MTTNPFSEWPFWHYYSLHVQNAPLIDEEFRAINPGARPILLSALTTTARNFNPNNVDPNMQTAERSSARLVNVIDNSTFYDFVNDRIVRGSDLDPNRVWVVTTGNRQAGIPSSFTPQTIGTIPRDAIVIVKGIGSGSRGGELLPLVASPTNMTHIFQALGPAQSIAKGEITTREGRPVVRYDVMGALSEPERENLGRLLRGPTYTNPTIEIILQSFRRQSAAPSDLERNATRIRNQLTKIIPEEKAINVASGALVNATAPCYNVIELQVVPPGTNEYRVVKFAFKTSIKDDDRQAYDALLRDRFRARAVQSAEVSVEQRRAISIQPIRASVTDYQNLFKSNEGFQSYIRRINEATSSQVVDVSQVLHGEVDNGEDEDLDDYGEEGEEELDEY